MKAINTICIIDDDFIYRSILQKMLLKLDVCNNIVAYENGEMALNAIKGLIGSKGVTPDIIFLDINMPVMNGWEFLEGFAKIKHQIGKQIAIYQTSSSEGLQHHSATTDACITEYLGKTMDRDILLRVTANATMN